MWPCLCWSRYFPGTGWLDFCLLLCRDWVLSLVRVDQSQRLSFWKMLPLVLFEGQAAGEIPTNTGPRRRSVGKRTENLVRSVTTLNSFFSNSVSLSWVSLMTGTMDSLYTGQSRSLPTALSPHPGVLHVMMGSSRPGSHVFLRWDNCTDSCFLPVAVGSIRGVVVMDVSVEIRFIHTRTMLLWRTNLAWEPGRFWH